MNREIPSMAIGYIRIDLGILIPYIGNSSAICKEKLHHRKGEFVCLDYIEVQAMVRGGLVTMMTLVRRRSRIWISPPSSQRRKSQDKQILS